MEKPLDLNEEIAKRIDILGSIQEAGLAEVITIAILVVAVALVLLAWKTRKGKQMPLELLSRIRALRSNSSEAERPLPGSGSRTQ